MAEHCMVIAGEWKSSADNLWNFSIDKDHMTRIVPLHSGISLTELLSNVFKEFFDKSNTIRTAVLSYWPPNSKELATGLTTQPIMLTNDGIVSFFYQHFQAIKGINLSTTRNLTSHRCSTTLCMKRMMYPISTLMMMNLMSGKCMHQSKTARSV
ncbi:hypothetical protein Bca52824_036276 [Brassica carinata]|uniref:Uncharacterized protein n=1 Tax=Brassica carinata TaxID=52824 RepID=A0A8X7V2H5_BRACI|nr:hypothetical protein Bca52824_036276 [Brassica carinata]